MCGLLGAARGCADRAGGARRRRRPRLLLHADVLRFLSWQVVAEPGGARTRRRRDARRRDRTHPGAERHVPDVQGEVPRGGLQHARGRDARRECGALIHLSTVAIRARARDYLARRCAAPLLPFASRRSSTSLIIRSAPMCRPSSAKSSAVCAGEEMRGETAKARTARKHRELRRIFARAPCSPCSWRSGRSRRRAAP